MEGLLYTYFPVLSFDSPSSWSTPLNDARKRFALCRFLKSEQLSRRLENRELCTNLLMSLQERCGVVNANGSSPLETMRGLEHYLNDIMRPPTDSADIKGELNCLESIILHCLLIRVRALDFWLTPLIAKNYLYKQLIVTRRPRFNNVINYCNR